MTDEPDRDVEAVRTCVDALRPLSDAVQRATIEYLYSRFVAHRPAPTPLELALRARVILEEAGREAPAKRWRGMVDAGLIDESGRVLCCGPMLPVAPKEPDHE